MFKRVPVSGTLRLVSRQVNSQNIRGQIRMLSLLSTKSFNASSTLSYTSSRYQVSKPSPTQSLFVRRYTPAASFDKPAELVTYEDVKKITLSEHPDIVIVDSREPIEYAAGFIPGAINLPIKSSPGALGLEEEDFKDAFGFEKPSKDKTLLFYCLAGVRSTAAEELAATFGYQKRANYKGSWEDWSQHESAGKQ